MTSSEDKLQMIDLPWQVIIENLYYLMVHCSYYIALLFRDFSDKHIYKYTKI